MGKLRSKLKQKIPPKITRWETQAGKFTTSQKDNIDLCIPEFSSTKILSWKYHADNKTNRGYDMILGRDLLTSMGLDLNISEDIIIGGEGTYEECLVYMVDLSNYDSKSLTEI